MALLACACSKKPKWYEANVRLTRVQTIRFDASGKATDVDVEVQYVDCPGGQQLEIIRGDAAFAACMKGHSAGETVKAKIQQHWDARGFWDWDIHELGGCKRAPDPDDINSFDTVQECEPIIANGVNEGFRCNRIPQRELLKKCPWFGRR